MSDEEIVATQQAGTDTYPLQAGALKKGSFLCINNVPCKVIDLSVSKTGKHGHAKVSITALGIFDGRKMEDQAPTTHNVSCPFVKTNQYMLLDIQEDRVTLMDADGQEVPGLQLPTYPETLAQEIRDSYAEGKEVTIIVTSAMGVDQITGTKSAQ